jgi:nitroreductase
MECFDTIFNRKSVRAFLDKPVEKEKLLELVKAGMAAPSARNLQPWHFLVITERERLDGLGERLPYAKMLKEAPAAVVICGDKAISDLWDQDCCAATENLLLAAEALGLGAVWTALYPREERMKVVKEAFDLPNNIVPLNITPIGYPKGEHQPKDKWDEEKLHWENW